MKISIVVAQDQEGGIGKDNQLPWHLSADLKHFKNITTGHHMLMGRKTYESIGKPLPNRVSIVLTRNKTIEFPEGVIKVSSVEEGIEVAKQAGEEELFMVGGGQLYKTSLEMVDTIHLTKVETRVEADTFFPILKEEEWEELKKESFEAKEKNKFNYHFITLKRIK